MSDECVSKSCPQCGAAVPEDAPGGFCPKCLIYELLTGELPLGRFAPPSEKAAIDARVDEVVLKALEKERDRRQQTASEVKTQIETIASEPPSPRSKPQGWQLAWCAVSEPRRRLTRTGVALLAMALLICFAWPQRDVTATALGTIETLTDGLGEPWLKEVTMYGPARQQWSELAAATPAFAAGLFGLLLWITLGGLQDAERAAVGRPRLRLVDWPGGKRRIRWGTVALGD